MLTIPFPTLDPVALEIGPITIRWYALAYLAGFILGWRYSLWLTGKRGGLPTAQHMDDFLTWAVLGVILGGRIGFVLFYNFDYYLANPLEALKIWHGGMSFHGGLLGVVAATILFSRQNGINPFALGDVLACVVPIGLFFGRIANFINGELYGRVTDVSWAIVFPGGGPLPRHPSQLYQAVLEGLVLLVVMAFLARRRRLIDRPGVMTGIFLIGYGLVRFGVEFFRQPDIQLGFLVLGLTMGQLLSIPMILIGIGVIFWACRPLSGTKPAP